MKKLLAFLLVAAMSLTMLGCGGGGSESSAVEKSTAASSEPASGEKVAVRIGAPKAPPTLPILHMIEDNVLGDDVDLQLDIWNAPDQLIAMVQDGNHDLFAFPLTVVAKLSNKGIPVKLMNVNTWGVTYFLTTDPEFKTWSDLKGKTVYVPLQSSPPDALTQYFLNDAGLKVGEDVNISYASMPEVTSLLLSGEAVYATSIEPQCTIAMAKDDKIIRALSFEDEWQRVTNTDTMIPNAGFGGMAPFLEENPELAERFQKAYAESLQWVLDNPAEAGKLAEKYLEMPAPMIEKAIPNMGLHYKSAVDSEKELDMFYNLLNDFDPSMIGGKIPDKSMYYNHE